MTQMEIRAMLRRADARGLREEAGISRRTVMLALGADRSDLTRWETGKAVPSGRTGHRWARFTAGLERHARVSTEMAAQGEAAQRPGRSRTSLSGAAPLSRG